MTESGLVAVYDSMSGNGVSVISTPEPTWGRAPKPARGKRPYLYSEAIVVDITATNTQRMF